MGHAIYFEQQSKWLLQRFLSASEQWIQGRKRDPLENWYNKADCSGVCRFQIRVYDKNIGDPVGPLMADESQEPLLISTKRPSSTGESGTLQKLTLVPQSGWPLPRVAPRASP